MILKKLTLLSLLSLLTLSLWGENIVYGIVPSSPPTIFIDEEGEPTGFLVELFTRIMDDLGYTYEFKIGPFTDIYPLIVSGEIDFFATLIRTPEREEIFYFPEIPAISGWGQFFVASGTEYEEVWSLSGKQIGVLSKDLNGVAFKEFTENLGLTCDFVEYRTTEDLLKAVREYEIYGGVIYNTNLIGARGIKTTSTVFSPSPGYAVTSLDSPFKKDLDKMMARFEELKEDEGSYYYDLMNKWILKSARDESRIITITLIGLALMGFSLLLALFFNRMLNRKIIQRTGELDFSNRILENASEGVLITDERGVILKTNRAYELISGYAMKELIGQRMSLMKSGKQDRDFYADLWERLIHDGFWTGEMVNRRKNGAHFVQSTSIKALYDRSDGIKKYVSIVQDRTNEQILRKELQHQAYHDTLTQLPNRRAFNRDIIKLIKVSARKGEAFAVSLLDMDNFKTFNDVHGHAQGDRLLVSITERLKLLSETSSIYRMGGDEFCIISPLGKEGNEEKEFEKISRAVRRCFEKSFSLHDISDVYVNTSVGASLYPTDGHEGSQLFKNADLALNHGKHREKGRIIRYRKEMEIPLKRRIKYENHIRHCLENDEILVYYQPKVDIKRKILTGAEALVRWRRSNGELIPPDEFITVAEETRMIIPIGEYVLNQSCRRFARLNREGHNLKLAVNLSGIQFSQENLKDVIKTALNESGLKPDNLELEITESIAMNSLDSIHHVMKDLKSLGLTMAMDDFGTGYSSLSYLKNFSLDTLKIDKSFVDRIPGTKEDGGIILSIISLAKILGMHLVGEGIESRDQLDFLKENGCREIQGYFFSRPLPYDEFVDFVKNFSFPD